MLQTHANFTYIQEVKRQRYFLCTSFVGFDLKKHITTFRLSMAIFNAGIKRVWDMFPSTSSIFLTSTKITTQGSFSNEP